jgi:predicted PurR-regulated permease PerM
VAALFAVYLGTFTDYLSRRLGVARGLGLILALLGSILGIGLVGLLIVPPVVNQFQDVFEELPERVTEWEGELGRVAQENQMLRRLLGPLGEGREEIDAQIRAWEDSVTEAEWFRDRVAALSAQGAASSQDLEDASARVDSATARLAELQAQAEGFLDRAFDQVREFFADAPRYVFSGIGVLIHLVSVLIMGIYMASKPSIYREGLIALTPPTYRELARDILADLGHTMRSWLVGLGISMLVLGSLTWVGLIVLDVPYSLAFGVFTGIAVIVPFFGTIVSTLLPALFVIGTGGVSKALLVILLGVVVHIFEANVVAPMVFEKQVELPPVLTILSVLVMAKLLGIVGLLVAVPVLAAAMVLIRRIFVHRILEGKGFHRIEKDAPAIISLPTGDGVLVHPSASEVNIPALLEG